MKLDIQLQGLSPDTGSPSYITVQDSQKMFHAILNTRGGPKNYLDCF